MRAIACAATLCVASEASARVVLRGGMIEDGAIESLSSAGVEVGGPGARVIGWDAVLRVEGEREAEARRFAKLADDLHRATARLDRGDIRLAAPLFAELFIAYGDAGGPTGRAICEGELRCRLARGDQTGAVEPFLLALEAASVGARLTGGSMARSAIDNDTGIVPALPPIFAGDPGALRDASNATRQWTTRTDANDRPPGEWSDLRLIAECYRVAADHAAARPAPAARILEAAPGDGSGAIPGASLVRDIVLARIGDADVRAVARERLAIEIAEHAGTWREAWARAAIGRSLALEPDPAAQRRAIVQLLHVPARFLRAQPYLAGVCLADAAAVLRALGEPADAASLLRELREQLPQHPADPDVAAPVASSPAASATQIPEDATTEARSDD